MTRTTYFSRSQQLYVRLSEAYAARAASSSPVVGSDSPGWQRYVVSNPAVVLVDLLSETDSTTCGEHKRGGSYTGERTRVGVPGKFADWLVERFKCCENIDWLARTWCTRQTLYRWHDEY